MEKIQVGYSRKESTDDYGSVGISGLVEFEPKSDDLQKEFDEMFLYLKMTVDAKLDGLVVKESKTDQVDHAATTHSTPEELPTEASTPEPVAEKSTPKEGATKGEVFISNAKVFRSNVKKARNGKIYGELRVGHDDLENHLPADGSGALQHYVTVKVWEPEEIAKIGSRVRMKNEDTGEVEEQERLILNKDDFIDVWGTFKPWQTDDKMYDLHASAIKKHQ